MSNRRASGLKVGAEIPHLLNFIKENRDLIGFVSNDYLFTGEFYLEIDFEYSAFDINFAPLFGGDTSNNNIRVLVGATSILIDINTNAITAYNVALLPNVKYKFKMRRDVSNVLFCSIDGGIETNLGVKPGTCDLLYIALGRLSGGLSLSGKVYDFDINGSKFNLNEGSGLIVSPNDASPTGEIITSNPEPNYVNNVMWEEI